MVLTKKSKGYKMVSSIPGFFLEVERTQWSCPSCTCMNEMSNTNCEACESPKPDFEDIAVESKDDDSSDSEEDDEEKFAGGHIIQVKSGKSNCDNASKLIVSFLLSHEYY